MLTDNWIVLAYIMIISSIILCGILPMILRLFNDRQHFYHYNLERQNIEYSSSNKFLTLQSNDNNVDYKIDQNFQRINSFEQPIFYTQIPFIDDDTFV
ncbi:unnamed protein product [Rotaria sordida]|uniref:Uncharacterized protein n=1 Tax=Rotaria sordida TaxID=392033 RepID=A0A814X358_9BILA|nr:unnamed protein product [Rotaria sordida]CAF3678097.1 unnamed protein product [Rotaria sordida]